MKYVKFITVVLFFLNISCAYKDISENTYVPPKQKSEPRFLYPKTAQENGLTGDAKVLLTISKYGTVDKAEVVQSSGHKILDDAAAGYCAKMTFYPAQRNGKPVYSRMEMDVKYNLAKPNWDQGYYIQQVNALYSRLKRTTSHDSRNQIENEILEKHNEFVKKVRDGLNFNYFIEKVISPDLTKEWEKDWDNWPLVFLLYHDFIQRCKDYDSLSNVKVLLNNWVREDLKYINESPAATVEEEQAKEKLILKIKNFINTEYPDILSDSLGIILRINKEAVS